MSRALDDIAAERARQISAEGWSTKHDDAYPMGKLAQALKTGPTYLLIHILTSYEYPCPFSVCCHAADSLR